MDYPTIDPRSYTVQGQCHVKDINFGLNSVIHVPYNDKHVMTFNYLRILGQGQSQHVN